MPLLMGDSTDIGAAAREGRPLVRHGSVHRCYARSLERRCNSPHARSCDTAPLNGSMASLTRFPSAAREQLIVLLAVVDGGQAFVAERGKTLSHVLSRKMREPIPSRRHHFAAHRIDIEFYAAAPAILRKNRAGERLAIIVEPDGPGLSAEERMQFFQRGKRLDEAVPGSGLGLAIVRDIAGL